MEIKDSIVDIPVQDPPLEEFSAADLIWTKIGTNEHNADDVALIPYSRVDAFINGECSNVECPTRFHIERGRKRSRGSLKEYKSDEYLLYRLYWCSFGPENHGEGGVILPSRRYRLNTRNRAARPQSMRGCRCHFAVKHLYARPSVAMIIYHERRHINKSGFICHGPLDKDAIGPGARKVPYVGNEIQQQTMSLIYLGIPVEDVLQTHIEGVQRYCGPNADIHASNYVERLEKIIKRSTHELDLDDQSSVCLWVDKNKKSVFFYQGSSDVDPFILGIQTEWQLQQMIRFGHQSLLATDSSFGLKKLKYPFYTLLVFDSRLHALPVAWIITPSIDKKDVTKWFQALVSRVHTMDPAWVISGFVIDDPATEVDAIRDVFHCPVLFSLWRLRRSWLKNVLKRCANMEVQREAFKRLGKVLYCVWSSIDYTEVLEEFMQDFIDQTSFIHYFKDCWQPKIEMWLATIRGFPLASLEACGATEAYHVKLKSKIYDDCHLDLLQRVDWLIHKLITEIHSSYWLDRYADESGSFETVKENYIFSTSWQRASQIPDDTISFDDKDHLFATVVSKRDNSQSHIIWNPGSEFAFCDCSWSMQGNICKHIIKANIMCQNNDNYSPSMSYLSYRGILENLWRKPADGSIGLDQSMAWVNQLHNNIQRLVKLYNSSDIGLVVSELPVKWACKKSRTHVGRTVNNALALLPGSKSNARKRSSNRKRNCKRKRLSRLMGST